MSIKGIPVGTTTPRPDWNQKDPRKADYIKNKPDFAGHEANKENPHNVTCDQIGAVSGSSFDAVVDEILDRIGDIDDWQIDSDSRMLELKETVDSHKADKNNPHGVTCEQIGAATVDDVGRAEQIANEALNIVAEFPSAEYINEEIARVEQIAYEARGFAEQSPSAEYVNNEIARVEQIANDALNTALGLPTNEYVLDEIEKAVEESKAVIVTVSGSTPSHTSQQIYALIQEGKVVYLQLWGNTFTICTACTASEAKFENSYVNSIPGADGKSYSAQVFRLFMIKNGTYASQATTIPAQTYVDAQIQYYLNK